MWKGNLIIFDGIWGSGKTALSKKLFSQMKASSQSVKLYLDDVEGHPLYNTEGYSSEDFFKVYCERLQNIIDEITNNNISVIIESLVINGLLFEATREKWPQDITHERLLHVNTLLQQVSPVLFFFYHQDVSKHWSDLVSIRGKDWEQYVQNEFDKNENNLIGFLNCVQQAGEKNFQRLNMSSKYQVDVTNKKWETIETLIFSH